MNKIILKGNIGHAPRISRTQEGREIATFSLATSSSWKDKTGEWQTHTDWHKIIVFREATVGWIKDLLQKGDTIYVEGKLTYRQKKNRHNHPRLTPYIVISGSGGKIEHIRSRKPVDHLSSAVSYVPNIQEDGNRHSNLSPKEQEETPFLENDLSSSYPGTSAHTFSSQSVPSERELSSRKSSLHSTHSFRKGENLMKTKLFILSFFALTAVLMLCGTDALATGNSPDAGLNASVGNLTSILNNNLVPIVLICGCLAGAAISFMKSSPAPFVIALITTASFGFAKVWINTTYAICV